MGEALYFMVGIWIRSHDVQFSTDTTYIWDKPSILIQRIYETSLLYWYNVYTRQAFYTDTTYIRDKPSILIQRIYETSLLCLGIRWKITSFHQSLYGVAHSEGLGYGVTWRERFLNPSQTLDGIRYSDCRWGLIFCRCIDMTWIQWRAA